MNKVLGFERINERTKRPNSLINFIKPLEGQDKELAQDFLERVAAICYPIMKANHIVVMSLEEYPPNMEFVGRNFNAGEVIQLVLKSPGTKQWLPFKHVQMVMMHELAHCKQMNHSKFFWQVRNSYADELKALWSKSYTGEGLWGRGQTLLSGRYTTEHMPDAASEPRSLCGGTYRRQGKKRKRGERSDKAKVSYAERQQRRIAKKFGVAGLNGVTLGDDEHTRNQLERNKYNPTKPRVAKSKRGRELRAAAALARFETNKASEVKPEPISLDTTDDDNESETDDEGDDLGGFNPEHNPNMVKVCGDEDPKDDDAQREMRELHDIDQQSLKKSADSTRNRTQKDPNVTVIADDLDVNPKQKDPWSYSYASPYKPSIHAPLSQTWSERSIKKRKKPIAASAPWSAYGFCSGATLSNLLARQRTRRSDVHRVRARPRPDEDRKRVEMHECELSRQRISQSG
ncbi:hypothetical protein MBLNU459_g8258t1 [Dothideomycetes sp. NU459]